MEQHHIEGVLNLAPEARGKVFLLGKWQPGRSKIPIAKETRLCTLMH
jgi:hypothetical protein